VDAVEDPLLVVRARSLSNTQYAAANVAVLWKGEEPMAGENIQWRHSLEEAREEARRTGKLVLIDLFNPG
jgi:hypothetical protein